MMPRSATFTFTDPIPYQAAIRAAEVEVLVTAKGDFHSELTQIDLHRLWMQVGRECLPRVFHSAVSAKRAVIVFLADANQAAMHHSGMEVSPGDIIVDGIGSTHHHRTWGPCRWRSMSLPPDLLAAAGYAFADREATVPSATHLVRPSPVLMSRLLRLHDTAEQLALSSPSVLAHPEVARSLENALISAMIACLTEATRHETGSRACNHALVIARFEEFLAANLDQPLYLADICGATGVSERTLRACCQAHLGMGPTRYLWLRRMHLARRALVLADPAKSTVTEIATNHGFWELGRFSTEFRQLFGVSPSVSLRCSPRDHHIFQGSPFKLSEFA